MRFVEELIIIPFRQIKAETLKSVSELKEKKEAEVNAITAKSELAGEEIRAETRELTAKLIAQGGIQSYIILYRG